MNRLDQYAGQLYLGFLEAKNFPEQEPEYKLAKWYDLFWLLIPIAGFVVFIEQIESRKYL